MVEGRQNCIALDDSKQCDYAFNWYIKNYHRDEDTILLTHVPELPSIGSKGLMGANTINLSGDYCETLYSSIAKSEKILEKYKKICVLKNFKYKAVLVHRDHSIGHTICETLKKYDASVVVTGQRGLGMISRTLLGSTSDYIAHHTNVPVLIVPFKNELNV